MFALNNLTADANQTSQAVLADGSTVIFSFRYRPAVQRWTFDVTWGSFVANGLGLSTHPNRLRTWRQVIPFGLAVAVADGTDPFMANDLDCSSGQTPRVALTILDSTAGRTDVADVEAASFT
jgi:hypothetical protein